MDLTIKPYKPKHFNPRSPRGGATDEQEFIVKVDWISIHAPHEGERRRCVWCRDAVNDISIHAPHEGERRNGSRGLSSFITFQSTLPTRGSDRAAMALQLIDLDFNPRSPRGGATFVPCGLCPRLEFQSTLPTRGSDVPAEHHRAGRRISIHAPHEGERLGTKPVTNLPPRFQSTLPTRGSD